MGAVQQGMKSMAFGMARPHPVEEEAVGVRSSEEMGVQGDQEGQEGVEEWEIQEVRGRGLEPQEVRGSGDQEVGSE